MGNGLVKRLWLLENLNPKRKINAANFKIIKECSDLDMHLDQSVIIHFAVTSIVTEELIYNLVANNPGKIKLMSFQVTYKISEATLRFLSGNSVLVVQQSTAQFMTLKNRFIVES